MVYCNSGSIKNRRTGRVYRQERPGIFRALKRKILVEIGNRHDNNLQFVVVERIRRHGSHALAEYVSVVRSLLRRQQRALFG